MKPYRPSLVFLPALLALLVAARPAPADQISAVDDKYRQAIDAAVDKGLNYLARSQQRNGSFPPEHTAITSLAIMSFLAKGYTPVGSPYSDNITRGVDYVLACQANGVLGNGMYNHNISTLMLSEISGMMDAERRKKVHEALAKALHVTLAAQAVAKGEGNKGGWRYSPGSTDSDISQSGWAMMALRSAYNNGAGVPKEAVDEAVKYILKCRCPTDGGFGYTGPGGSGVARTGIGLLCLELSGHHRDPMALSAAKFIHARDPSSWSGELSYYAFYYTANSMFQLGGDDWDIFAPKLYDLLLKLQQPDGSWADFGSSHEAGMPCYRTAMAVLALCVSSRQLPIYQR
jgi:hypothetical protein